MSNLIKLDPIHPITSLMASGCPSFWLREDTQSRKRGHALRPDRFVLETDTLPRKVKGI